MPIAAASVTLEIVLPEAGAAPSPIQVGPTQLPINRGMDKEREVCPRIGIQFRNEKEQTACAPRNVDCHTEQKKRNRIVTKSRAAEAGGSEEGLVTGTVSFVGGVKSSKQLCCCG